MSAEFLDEDYEPPSKKVPKEKKKNSASKKSKTITKVKVIREKKLKKEIELPMKIDLVKLVKEECSLYNLKSSFYMNRIHKEKIWENISSKLNEKYPEMTVDKWKKLWLAVRESTR